MSCSYQSTKKYSSRPSPPYKANECCGMTELGNDKQWYDSLPDKNGICKWVKQTPENVNKHHKKTIQYFKKLREKNKRDKSYKMARKSSSRSIGRSRKSTRSV